MANWFGKLAASGLLVGSTGLLASACVDAEASLFVVGIMAPTDDCLYVADEESPLLAEGVLDLSIRQSYDAMLLVGTELVSVGDPERVRAETSRITIYEAEISVETDQGETESYSWPTTGFVHPEEPGYGIAFVRLFGPDTAGSFAGRLQPGTSGYALPSVVLRGRTLGGEEVESGPFTVPVRVCEGCLTAGCGTSDPCIPGQDQAVFTCE